MRTHEKQLHFDGYGLDDLVTESVQYIKDHEPPEGYFVGFSGGKDSIVTLELCRMAGVKYQAWHSLTGIDPPEVVHFIHKNYPEMHYAKPKKSIYQLIFTEAPPNRLQRWCCDKLKKIPSQNVPMTSRIMGIRAEESVRRASRGRESTFKVGKIVQTTYKPIFQWKEWAVWEFIEVNKLPYPSLYDEGFSRVGCVCCPFQASSSEAGKRRLEISRKRWPGIWRAYKNACRTWFDAKNKVDFPSFSAWWEWYWSGEKMTIEQPKQSRFLL